MTGPMRVTVIGGGPGGLYCALLTKKRRPGWQVEVYEQNRADDSFGFGVVFSDETLHEFLSRDPRSFARIRDAFSYWDDVAIHKEGRVMRCGGMSGWQSSSVSALCVKASCGSMAAVQGPATCATWSSPMNEPLASVRLLIDW